MLSFGAGTEHVHITAVGYDPADTLYTARCSCGTDRRFLAWKLVLAWRDSHGPEGNT